MGLRRTRVMVSMDTDMRQTLSSLIGDIETVTTYVSELVETAKKLSDQISESAVDQATEEIGVQVEAVEPELAKKNGHHPQRMRETPYTRRPKSEQIAWLMTILADREWHTAVEIAKEYATDTGHYRYLRAAVNRSFGELYQEGKVERGDSDVRGAMFSYRLSA